MLMLAGIRIREREASGTCRQSYISTRVRSCVVCLMQPSCCVLRSALPLLALASSYASSSGLPVCCASCSPTVVSWTRCLLCLRLKQCNSCVLSAGLLCPLPSSSCFLCSCCFASPHSQDFQHEEGWLFLHRVFLFRRRYGPEQKRCRLSAPSWRPGSF